MKLHEVKREHSEGAASAPRRHMATESKSSVRHCTRHTALSVNSGESPAKLSRAERNRREIPGRRKGGRAQELPVRGQGGGGSRWVNDASHRV